MEKTNLEKNEVELKRIKDLSPDEIKKELKSVVIKLLKVKTKARNNQPSRTYYQATVIILPGICEKAISLKQDEFIHVLKKNSKENELQNENREISIIGAARFSKGQRVDDMKEVHDYWLVELLLDNLVRKSIFLTDLDADNIGDDIEFITRKGVLTQDLEVAEIMPTFLS